MSRRWGRREQVKQGRKEEGGRSRNRCVRREEVVDRGGGGGV